MCVRVRLNVNICVCGLRNNAGSLSSPGHGKCYSNNACIGQKQVNGSTARKLATGEAAVTGWQARGTRATNTHIFNGHSLAFGTQLKSVRGADNDTSL